MSMDEEGHVFALYSDAAERPCSLLLDITVSRVHTTELSVRGAHTTPTAAYVDTLTVYALT
jgi:hypothetical protein